MKYFGGEKGINREKFLEPEIIGVKVNNWGEGFLKLNSIDYRKIDVIDETQFEQKNGDLMGTGKNGLAIRNGDLMGLMDGL